MKRAFPGRPLVHLLLIAVFGFLAYSNTFNVPFRFDGEYAIVDNPIIKDFGYFIDPSKADGLPVFEDIKRYFRTRYVGFLSLWANHRVGGLNVAGYHLANLAIHIANSLLVLAVQRATRPEPDMMPMAYPFMQFRMIVS